jgi:selenocysteine lyase/cysteine desulfurase
MNRKTFIQSLAAGSAGLLATARLPARATEPACHPALSDLGRASWSDIRALFPLQRDHVYLNTGGLGPASQPALDAVSAQNIHQAHTGEHHRSQFTEAHDIAARFFNVAPGEIAFTRNASEANSLVASGLSLGARDEIVFESHAHPGGSFPWMNRQKLHGTRVRIFEPGTGSHADNLQRLFDQVTARTRVIQVSHITATTGLVFDIAAIAREARRRGIWFHVDGAQSAGMIPVDLKALGCDSYATSGHKWLNAPIETGLLYIAAERNDEIDCSHIGAYSSDEYELPDSLTYVDSARRHEYGTRNAASVLGMAKAFELQESIGRVRIAEHGARLARMAEDGLRAIKGLEILTPVNPGMRNSILTFRVPGIDCGGIYQALLSGHKVRTRVVNEQDLNAVRTSWHVYHDEPDVERFLAGTRATLAQLG